MKKTIFHFVKSNYLTGVENVVINICKLVKGYNYTVVSTEGPLVKYLTYYGINHITIPNLNPITIFKVIKKYKPDIVQAHDARMTVILAFSGFYCHYHGIKMISELHNNDPKMRQPWRLRSIAYAFSSFFYNNIITVSRYTANDYFYYKLIKHKTVTIFNIVNYHRIKLGLNPYITKKTWDCIFIGRFVDQKNPFKFIMIIYYLKKIKKNIKAVMVGNGQLLKSAIKLSKKYKVYKNIDFVGFQRNPYIYLQKSKLLIMTSKYEGLPLVALESIISKVPVISTPLKVLRYILGNIDIFETLDRDFVKKICKLIYDKRYYFIIKALEQKKVNQFNNVHRFVRMYSLIYKK